MESWMRREDHQLIAQEIALLERAKRTLEGNIAVPGEGHVNPLPWHPLRGIRPSLDDYDGVWNWDSAFHAMAVSRWDPELARAELRDAFEKTRQNVVEVNLQDLHTVRNEPHRLTEWTQMAMQLAEEYA